MPLYTENSDPIFFMGVMPFLNFKILPKWYILLKQFVSATPLKPLNRIWWNLFWFRRSYCVDVRIFWKFWFILFWWVMHLLNLEILPKLNVLLKKCYTNVTIINRVYVSDYNWYLITIFCPIAHYLCMALLFVMCSIVKECWSVGYVSLLTLSFICSVLYLVMHVTKRWFQKSHIRDVFFY